MNIKKYLISIAMKNDVENLINSINNFEDEDIKIRSSFSRRRRKYFGKDVPQDYKSYAVFP